MGSENIGIVSSESGEFISFRRCGYNREFGPICHCVEVIRTGSGERSFTFLGERYGKGFLCESSFYIGSFLHYNLLRSKYVCIVCGESGEFVSFRRCGYNREFGPVCHCVEVIRTGSSERSFTFFSQCNCKGVGIYTIIIVPISINYTPTLFLGNINMSLKALIIFIFS